MSKIKKEKEIKISKEKEKAIEKLFKKNEKPRRAVIVKVAKTSKLKIQKRKSPKEITEKKEILLKKDVVVESLEKKGGFDFQVLLKRNSRIILAIGLIIFLAIVSSAVFFHRTNKNSLENQLEEIKSLQAVKDRIGVFMDLPSDEEPVFATVTDIEKIKDQKFFSRAQNGDKVLIYTKNQKAVLYRWQSNRLIEVSNVTGLEENKSEQTPQASAEQSVWEAQDVQAQTADEISTASVENEQQPSEAKTTVVVLNGSKISGLAKKLADEISTAPGIEIVEKANAKGSYPKTLVIDLSGAHLETAGKIAEMIGGQVGEFPVGEKKPEADLLVIGGEE